MSCLQFHPKFFFTDYYQVHNVLRKLGDVILPGLQIQNRIPTLNGAALSDCIAEL